MSQGKLPENVMAQVKIILGKWERSEICLFSEKKEQTIRHFSFHSQQVF
jgi:hypothetical protein